METYRPRVMNPFWSVRAGADLHGIELKSASQLVSYILPCLLAQYPLIKEYTSNHTTDPYIM